MLDREPDLDSGARQPDLRPPTPPVDLDKAEKDQTEEKLRATGWTYVKRLIKPVSEDDRRVYVILFGYLRPYLRKVLLAVFLSALGGSMTLFQLQYIMQGVEAISPKEQQTTQEPGVGPVAKLQKKIAQWRGLPDPTQPDPNVPPPPPPAPKTKTERFQALQITVAMFIGFVAIASLLKYVREVMMASVSRKMIRDVREDCFKNLIRLPLSFHQTQHSSRMLSRLTKDITRLRQGFISVSLGIVSETCVFLAALGFALWQLGWVAVLLFVFVILAFIPIRVIGDRLRYRDKQAEAGEADLFAIIQEALLGQKIVKAFTAEKREIRRFRDTARAMYRNQMSTYRLRAMTEPIVDLIAGASLAAGIWLLGGLVLDGALDVAVLTAVIIAMQRLNRSVAHLGKHQNDFVRGMTAGERLVELLDQQPEVHEAKDAIPLERFESEIVYDNVKFSYVRGSRALRGISLTIQKGETVAIVGPSGAGKTSLVDLLPRFYDPNKGKVTIDGIDVREYTLKSLRQLIGIVSQETILFSGTIAENIAYGVPNVTREMVIEAARAACAHDFIMAKDNGYDTDLGESGRALSGGERQRIAIARALLKNPPILILDEATSALDAESEAHVQQALENLMKGRTTIVIAHRLSTVRRANHIVVVRGGTVVEEGDHEDLLAKNGLYARAYNLQMEAMLRGEPRSTIDRYFKRAVDDDDSGGVLAPI
jgi:subfamily B ATP-binding cassette protein MsbA